MTSLWLFGIFSALVWGSCWAVFLYATERGKWLREQLTFVTVVVGVGVDLLIIGAFLPVDLWLLVWGVIAASGVPIVIGAIDLMIKTHKRALARAREGINE